MSIVQYKEYVSFVVVEVNVTANLDMDFRLHLLALSALPIVSLNVHMLYVMLYIITMVVTH